MIIILLKFLCFIAIPLLQFFVCQAIMNVLETNTNLKAVRLTNQVGIDYCLALDSYLTYSFQLQFPSASVETLGQSC